MRRAVGLYEQKPEGEDHGVDVEELHRSGEGGDGVGDPQLQVGGATGLVRHHDRVVLGLRVELIHVLPFPDSTPPAGASRWRPPLPPPAHAPAKPASAPAPSATPWGNL